MKVLQSLLCYLRSIVSLFRRLKRSGLMISVYFVFIEQCGRHTTFCVGAERTLQTKLSMRVCHMLDGQNFHC